MSFNLGKGETLSLDNRLKFKANQDKRMKKLFMFTIAWSALNIGVSAQEDFREILSVLLDNENMQERLSLDQRETRTICLVTPEGTLESQGKIDEEWLIQTASADDVQSDCLVLLSKAIDHRKARLKFTYGKYRIKAKFRNGEEGWFKTSLSIKGKGTFVVDKEF